MAQLAPLPAYDTSTDTKEATTLDKVTHNPDPHPDSDPHPHPDPGPDSDPSPDPDPGPDPDPDPDLSPTLTLAASHKVALYLHTEGQSEALLGAVQAKLQARYDLKQDVCLVMR